MHKVSYSAIVLTNQSREKLLAAFVDRIPKGWEAIAHHCTVNMGELPQELKNQAGSFVQIQVFGFFSNDLVCATQVVVPREFQSFMRNKFPHITLGVNRAVGGKPVMSNAMIEGSVKAELESDLIGTNTHTPIHLTGILKEV